MPLLRRSPAARRATRGPFLAGLAGGVVALLWIGMIVAGFRALMQYESKAGAAASPTSQWLAGVPFELDPALPTLVLFAHPRCPCTRATLGELDRILAHSDGRLRTHVVFYSDPALGPDWHHSDLWDQAAGMDGVEVHEDPHGELAQRFGALTSGQVFLYAPGGALIFQGGITAGRGRAGDSNGSRDVLALIQDPTAEPAACAVFGCALTSTQPLPSAEPDL